MYIYPKFKDIRIRKGYTQNQIAKYLNIQQVVYSRYETGEREMPLHCAIELAKLYKVSIDFLVGLSIKE